MTLRILGSVLIMAFTGTAAMAADPIDVGSRRELFVDDYLIDRMEGAALRLHPPTPQGVALRCDEPWEGNGVNYVTVFRDGERYRMYYRGLRITWTPGKHTNSEQVYCYAESEDGVGWVKPQLGLFEFDGSKENNIVWRGQGSHNFVPFRDTNPSCKPDQRYKAVASDKGGLYAFSSPDGIHWSLVSDKPVVTEGAFDSQNLAFWDSVRGQYREYHRDFRDGRDIRTATSDDFLHWSDPVFLDYVPGRLYQLYTNQIAPYYRAPHLFLGFPTCYFDRGWTESTKVLPEPEQRKLRASASQREGTALTDGLFMTSRDGGTFHLWAEAFLRPGPQRKGSWFYGDHYQAWGLVETKSVLDGAPNELSTYVTESTSGDTPVGRLRRYTLRIDGFVSVEAPAAGGELLTKQIVFDGKELAVNFSTSVAGGIRVEIQDADGKPIPGYGLAESEEVFGDELDRVVRWKSGSDLSKLAGRPVRLRFVLQDADLYAIRFRP